MVVFPDPDSPTSPKTSPSDTVKLTPSTALKAGVPSLPGYSMVRFSASTSTFAFWCARSVIPCDAELCPK
jgi:hypothetical protein